MTEVDVHFNAQDKVGHACRLLRKAVLTAGARVAVAGDRAVLDSLDASLWQFSATDFIAHCRTDADEDVVRRSPVLLLDDPGQGTPAHHQVLVNLGCELPLGFERFERLIDVVGVDDEERQAGRQRWRHYAERGYSITRHDLGGPR